MNKILVPILAITVIAVAGIAAFIFFNNKNDKDTQKDLTPTPTVTQTPSTNSTLTPTEETSSEEIDYSITMTNNLFSPDLIIAEPGETLRIELIDIEGTHSFISKDFKVQSKTLTESNSEQIFELTIPANTKPGNYEFYCGQAGHRQLGMVGTIQVVEKTTN